MNAIITITKNQENKIKQIPSGTKLCLADVAHVLGAKCFGQLVDAVASKSKIDLQVR